LRETLIQRGVARNLAPFLSSWILPVLSRPGAVVLPLPKDRDSFGADQHIVQPTDQRASFRGDLVRSMPGLTDSAFGGKSPSSCSRALHSPGDDTRPTSFLNYGEPLRPDLIVDTEVDIVPPAR